MFNVNWLDGVLKVVYMILDKVVGMFYDFLNFKIVIFLCVFWKC